MCLINSTFGGSPVQAWMSYNELEAFPYAFKEAQKYKNDQLISEIQRSYEKRSNHWSALVNSAFKVVANKN